MKKFSPLYLRNRIFLTFVLLKMAGYGSAQAVKLENKVEEQTREVLKHRQEVDELKSRFYTNISHEFRTPLTLLLGPLNDALKSKSSRISFQSRVVRVMQQNAMRLQRLINQLLDISRLESGKMKLNLSKGNISKFVRLIASSFTSLAESKHIEFTVNIMDFDGDVCFDPEKIEEITTNLLSNAFKFTPENGEISLELFPLNEDNIKKAKLIISDSGIGMNPDQLEKIFERFYQISDSDTRKAEGSGIGLSLTRELIELMHGNIEVESEPGKGTFLKRFLSVIFDVDLNYLFP